jgi:hypothetical protein
VENFIEDGPRVICIDSQHLSTSMSTNINGPCFIEVPHFARSGKMKFLLYFAQHSGSSISLATSNSPYGPWEILTHSTLTISSTHNFHDHIASPHVEIDLEKERFLMYFHSRVIDSREQTTFLAESKDGINFTPIALESRLPFYFRMQKMKDFFVGVSKGGDIFINQSRLFDKGWEFLGNPFIGHNETDKYHNYEGAIRHPSFFIHNGKLLILYSRIGDTPERIIKQQLNITTNSCELELAVDELLFPVLDFEGANEVLTKSQPGIAISKENALRDPHLVKCKDSLYLYYAFGGESGIGVVRLNSESESDKRLKPRD